MSDELSRQVRKLEAERGRTMARWDIRIRRVSEAQSDPVPVDAIPLLPPDLDAARHRAVMNEAMRRHVGPKRRAVAS